MTAIAAEQVEKLLRDELAQGDAVLATAPPILRHLLANDDQSFFSDEVIARVRGLLGSVARQLLFALAGAADVEDRHEFADRFEEEVTRGLFERHGFLAHAHALTIEAQLVERLLTRNSIDSVLSPLLQDLASSEDEAAAVLAMSVLTAEARFVQQQRRMFLPLGELTGDLFHEALQVMGGCTDIEDAGQDAAAERLRQSFDERRTRLSLLSRLVMRLEDEATKALDLEHAGVSIFATALAMASKQERELAVLSLYGRQFARLALSLRAAGMKQEDLEAQFLQLHPEAALPEGLETLRADRAAALLGPSGANAGF